MNVELANKIFFQNLEEKIKNIIAEMITTNVKKK